MSGLLALVGLLCSPGVVFVRVDWVRAHESTYFVAKPDDVDLLALGAASISPEAEQEM